MYDKEEFCFKTLQGVVIVVIVVATTMCVYIFFFHFNCCSCLCPDGDGVYRYAILCRCRSLSSFLRFFSIRLTLAIVSALCCLSFSPSCSVTIHFTRVLLCLSYSAPSCSVSMCAICIFFGVV
jgi:hypothetical protein